VINLLKFYEFRVNKGDNVFDELSEIIIDGIDGGLLYFEIREYSKSVGVRKLKVKSLKITINKYKSKENLCNANIKVSKETSIEDDYLIGSQIEFNVFINDLNDDFKRYIHSVVKHEVLHLYQIYNLKINKKFSPESWTIGSILPLFNKTFKEEYTKKTIMNIYKSLSHEIYSQLYQYYFYKKDGLEYKKIGEIIEDLRGFVIEENLSDHQIIEINTMRKYILDSLLKNGNRKWKGDVNNSLWKKGDVHQFLKSLKDLFIEKSNLIESKMRRIDKELSLDDKINEMVNEYEYFSLPTNFDELDADHLSILDDLILDVFY